MLEGHHAPQWKLSFRQSAPKEEGLCGIEVSLLPMQVHQQNKDRHQLLFCFISFGKQRRRSPSGTIAAVVSPHYLLLKPPKYVIIYLLGIEGPSHSSCMTLVATSYGLEQEDKLKLRAQHFQTALKHLQIGAGMCQTSLWALKTI